MCLRFLALLVPTVAGCAPDPAGRPLGESEAAGGRVAVTLRPAPRIQFRGAVDSNSPAWWDADWGLVVMNSEFEARGSAGTDVFHLGPAEPVAWDNQVNGGRWIEATWTDGDGVVYGWYHNEPFHLCCTFDARGREVAHSNLTAPQIGAARSVDAGGSWQDLGIVMRAPPGSLDCDSVNTYFAGGNGDFSVMLDPAGEYLYFFFTTFAGAAEEQGVAMAWMSWADRDDPIGKVYKRCDGDWYQPGLGGCVTPLWSASGAVAEPGFDAPWGPSIHWNTHLERYVILMNRAQGPDWSQEGIYLTHNPHLSSEGWSAPERIAGGEAGWYPQVIGTGDPQQGTDKLAGRVSRFFVAGRSDQELVLDRIAD